MSKFFDIMIKSKDYSIEQSKSVTEVQGLSKLKSQAWDVKIDEYLKRKENEIESCPPTFAIQDTNDSLKYPSYIQISFMNCEEIYVTYSIPLTKKFLRFIPIQSERKFEFYPRPRTLALKISKLFFEDNREQIKNI